MTNKEKLSEEEYKLAEEVIKPIYYNAIQNDYSFAKYGVECFLAGVKAARLEWHDLRKDPNDLPRRDKDFVVNVTIPVMTYPSYVFAYYYDDNKKWFSLGKEIDVIAWCEIPQFKDKE